MTWRSDMMDRINRLISGDYFTGIDRQPSPYWRHHEEGQNMDEKQPFERVLDIVIINYLGTAAELGEDPTEEIIAALEAKTAAMKAEQQTGG